MLPLETRDFKAKTYPGDERGESTKDKHKTISETFVSNLL